MRKLVVSLLAAALLVATGAAAGCAGSSTGVTEGEFYQMNNQEKAALVSCQVEKYAGQVGHDEAYNYVANNMANEITHQGANVTPVQVRLINKGVTCTTDEMAKYDPRMNPAGGSEE